MVTPMSSIEGFLKTQIERRQKAIINTFEYIGIACQNEARENGSYTDRTGNLRSSIGYVLVVDGMIHSLSQLDQNTGGAKGQHYLKQLTSQFPHGIALILVAGMQYAARLEAIDYNVLTSAELMAGEMIPKLMKQLGFTPK